jgi:hypothetical protein
MLSITLRLVFFSSPGLLIDKADWEQIGLIEINALGPTLRAVVLVT